MFERIGLLFVILFAVAVLTAKVDPQEVIDAPECVLIGKCGVMVSLFLVPALFVLFPPRIIFARSVQERAFYAVVVSWFCQVQFWKVFVQPVQDQLKFERGDMTDGFASSFGMELTAWLPSLLLTLVYIAAKSWLVPPLKTNAEQSVDELGIP